MLNFKSRKICRALTRNYLIWCTRLDRHNLNINAPIIVTNFEVIRNLQKRNQRRNQYRFGWFVCLYNVLHLNKNYSSIVIFTFCVKWQYMQSRLKSFSTYNRYTFYQPITTIIIGYYILPVSIFRIPPWTTKPRT